MTVQRREKKTYLRHLIGQGEIRLKDVYCLLTSVSPDNRRAKQSRFLHDNFYDTRLNGLCHEHIRIEYT